MVPAYVVSGLLFVAWLIPRRRLGRFATAVAAVFGALALSLSVALPVILPRLQLSPAERAVCNRDADLSLDRCHATGGFHPQRQPATGVVHGLMSSEGKWVVSSSALRGQSSGIGAGGASTAIAGVPLRSLQVRCHPRDA